jgi:hypothetical protein
MISVKELKEIAERKKKIKKECFKKILELVNNKILLISKTDQTSTWFEIPLFMLGYPTYEIKESSDYIIKKLSEKEFNVNFLEPNILLINW